MIDTYLTESGLEKILEQLYPSMTFIRDKMVPNSNIRTRPDFRCDEIMLIVEFDGYMHYQATSKIKREKLKTHTYTEMGYNVVRIPYFVQMSTITIKNLFNLVYKYEQVFPHGFISNKAMLPSDFSEM